MELTAAFDKANMNLKAGGEQNAAMASKIQILEVDITKIRQVSKVYNKYQGPKIVALFHLLLVLKSVDDFKL